MHLIVDGTVAEQLPDSEAIAVLPELALLIGMTPVGPVHIQYFDLPQHKELGISAVQFLAQSHIILNYFRNSIGVDIFSCNSFNVYTATGFCVIRFKMDRIKVTLLDRKFIT